MEKEQFDKIWKALKVIDDHIFWLISHHPVSKEIEDMSKIKRENLDLGPVEFIPPDGK